MIEDYSQILALFVELDGAMSEGTAIYLIGGGALMKWSMKSRTKDIDVVADSVEGFNRVRNAFKAVGFGSISPTREYERMAISEILVRGDYRVDLFCKKVCGQFSVSEGMRKRSIREKTRSKNLELFVCSPEDIFLFKTITDREGDYDDCVKIIENKADFDWGAVLKEAQEQSRAGQAVWITWITSRLEEFAERAMTIPILNQMRKLADDYLVEWERDLLSRNPDPSICDKK
jgi:hypothetical protein